MYYFLKPCENCTCSQGLGEVCSAEYFSDIPASVLWRLNLTAVKSSCNANETASYHDSQFGMMCEPSTANPGLDLLMSSAEDSHAKTLALQGKEKELEEPEVGFGQKWQESFAKYNPNTCSWKIRQLWLFGDLEQSLEIWPRWGLMRDGECFEEEMLVLRQNEKEFSYWPTPTKRDYKGASNGQNLDYSRWTTWLHHNVFHSSWTTYPNPSCSEAVMGWPISWSELKPLETDKFQEWLRLHGERFQDSNTK